MMMMMTMMVVVVVVVVRVHCIWARDPRHATCLGGARRTHAPQAASGVLRILCAKYSQYAPELELE
jgi:hypothetical protein